MSRPITTTLSDIWYIFLNEQAKKEKITKNKVLEKALQYYKKEQIKQEIQEGLKVRQTERDELQQNYADAQILSVLSSARV